MEVEDHRRSLSVHVPSQRTKELLFLFGLTYPIFQAPIGPSSSPDLASAISGAGAMGSMAMGRVSIQEVQDRVKKVLLSTKRPFVVNYILAFEPQSLDAALHAGAPIVQFSWGIPDKHMVAAVRSAHARFGVQVANADGARAALDAGADYLVRQGIEAGGHVQASSGLLDALPKVLSEVNQTPVLAAGGIGDGAGIRRVLEAGASGAVLGTRFLATKESYAHPDYKQALLQADGSQTALSVCFQDGWIALHRSLRNDTLIRWEAAGCPPPGKRPGEEDVLGRRPDGQPVLRYAVDSPPKSLTGDHVRDCALYAGTGVGLVRDMPAAADLVRRLWAECEAASA